MSTKVNSERNEGADQRDAESNHRMEMARAGSGPHAAGRSNEPRLYRSCRDCTLHGSEIVVVSAPNLTPDPADAANGDFA